MKRVFVLALACMILVFSFAPNASATEIDNTYGLELLDYGTVNDSGSNTIIIPSSGALMIYVPMPTSYYCRYVEVVFSLPSDYGTYPEIETVRTDVNARYDLEVMHIGDRYYRAYGRISGNSYDKLYLNFTATRSMYVTIESVRVYGFYPHYDVEAYCDISASGYNATIHYVPTDTINSRTFTGSDDYMNSAFSLFFYCNDWKKFDYLDVRFYINCSSLNSVSCFHGDVVVPVESSVIESGVGNYFDYYIHCRIDLAGLDKSSSVVPKLVLSGQVNVANVNYVSITSVSGFVKVASHDKLYYYFTGLQDMLRAKFDALIQALDGDRSSGDQFKDDSSELISGLGDISASMNSVERPSMDSINADYSGDISDASTLMASLFTEISGVSWVSRIILASVTIGLISYILYGKE